jgi:hypothetical protein
MFAIPKQDPLVSLQGHFDQREARAGPQSPRGPGAFLYLPRSHQARPWGYHSRPSLRNPAAEWAALAPRGKLGLRCSTVLTKPYAH